MAKSKKKTKSKEHSKNFWMSMTIVFLMITSIAGFALMWTSGVSTNKEGIPKDYPLQLVNYKNQTFWVVIKNYEQFVFDNIDVYQNDTEMIPTAEEFKNLTSIKLYISPNSDRSAAFLIERLAKATDKPLTVINNSICESGVFYLSTPEESSNITGDCLRFIYPKNKQYFEANSLVYYVLR
jgi:hypothetical protein